MTLRPTIEDSLTLPHIHSIKLISWLLSPPTWAPTLCWAPLEARMLQKSWFENSVFISSSTYPFVTKYPHICYICWPHCPANWSHAHPEVFFFFFSDLQRGHSEGHLLVLATVFSQPESTSTLRGLEGARGGGVSLVCWDICSACC